MAEKINSPSRAKQAAQLVGDLYLDTGLYPAHRTLSSGKAGRQLAGAVLIKRASQKGPQATAKAAVVPARSHAYVQRRALALVHGPAARMVSDCLNRVTGIKSRTNKPGLVVDHPLGHSPALTCTPDRSADVMGPQAPARTAVVQCQPADM